ncbi:MAG: hypothetical protein RJA99_1386 [Pseudomonadota bacterium]|jgi:hypothetical protein
MAADRSPLPALALALALALGVPAAAGAAAPDPSPPLVSKPARTAVAKAAAAPTLGWHDGAVRRPLVPDPTLEADFTPRADGIPGVLRPAGSAPRGASAMVSPVYRDDAGRARALPGGVLVVLRAPATEDEGRARIERAGAKPVRRLSETLWLVEGPVGQGSLELAERLHGSGGFESAQPNWWVERTLK